MARAPELHWNEGDRWSVTLDLPTSRAVSLSPKRTGPAMRPHIEYMQPHASTGSAVVVGSGIIYVQSCVIDCTCRMQVEYKFVVVAADGVSAAAWQSGNNSVLAVQAGEEALEVFDNW